MISEDAFGVYVHIPFCESRCDYCAFVTFTDKDEFMAPVARAIVQHLELAKIQGILRPVSSLYFGGGTPSRLPVELLVSIIEAVDLAAGAEVSIEMNPEDVDEALISRLLAAGVNRFSFGIQSVVPSVLAALGRKHSSDDLGRIARVMEVLAVENWSVDLIFGAVGESDAQWLHSLDQVMSLPNPPPHLSCYALSPEKGTPLHRDPERHPDDDVLARRYELADEVLTSSAYEFEEISSWAKPGHACKHHELYWTGGEYLGLGPGAHGFLKPKRMVNHATPERYVAALASGEWPIASEEILDEETMLHEALALRLRTAQGVPQAALDDEEILRDLVALSGDRKILTLKGRLLANEVAIRLKAPAHEARED